jgi:hypothetical protein
MHQQDCTILLIFVCAAAVASIFLLVRFKKRDHFTGTICPKISYASGKYVLSYNDNSLKTFQSKDDAIEAWKFAIQQDLSLLSCSLEASFDFNSCDLSSANLRYNGGKYVLELNTNTGNSIVQNYDDKDSALEAWKFITVDNPNITNCFLNDLSANSAQTNATIAQISATGSQISANVAQNNTTMAQNNAQNNATGSQNNATMAQNNAQNNATVAQNNATMAQNNANVVQNNATVAQNSTQNNATVAQNNATDAQNIANVSQTPASIVQSNDVLVGQSGITDQLQIINKRLLRQDTLQKSDSIKLNKLLDLFNKNINTINEKNARLKYATGLQQDHIANVAELSNQLNNTAPMQTQTQTQTNDISQAQKMGTVMQGQTLMKSNATNNKPVFNYTKEEIKVLGRKLNESQLKIAENDIMIWTLSNELKRAREELQNDKVIIEDIEKKMADGSGQNNDTKKLAECLYKYRHECPKSDPRPLYSPTYPVNVMEIERQGHNSILTAPIT